MANRNKQAGNKLELDVVHRLKEMGYEAASSRQESRSADARGIDIITTFPREIQCKSMVNTPPIHKILTETDADMIVWRKQEKKGTRFYAQGDYAILSLDDFFKLIK